MKHKHKWTDWAKAAWQPNSLPKGSERQVRFCHNVPCPLHYGFEERVGKDMMTDQERIERLEAIVIALADKVAGEGFPDEDLLEMTGNIEVRVDRPQ